ncbi:hypothetical protein PRZ48_005440 [Zasmidium cellare]|uniref:C2H2-type domain-containing protein n=1 Tax=Zasmidium cellare TaxID=395010 RepID=A0ABR0ET14_ZASCE|nr:hypothetical protein PRZ48_005440 [Zasmidium cellare]
MGNKKRKHGGESLEDVLARPWCYYCERDFDNMKVLVDHQKVKHFQCHFGSCHRRLNTIGGLRVHMQQVHKAELHEVPNANENRRDVNVEIFAMVGVPESLINARNEIVTRAYHNMEAEHMRRTGNPLAGSAAAKEREETNSSKKVKIEDKEDLKRRVAEAKAKREAIKKAQAMGLPPPTASSTPPSATTPQAQPNFQAQNTPTPPAMQGYGAPPVQAPPPINSLPPGFGLPFMPPGFPPNSHPLPGGMAPGYGMGPMIPPPGSFGNYHDPAPQIPKMPSAMSGRPSAETPDPTPVSNFGYPPNGNPSPAPIEAKARPAPTMTKEEVTAGIDAMWESLAAQKAAGVTNPQIPGLQPNNPPASISPAPPTDGPTPTQAKADTKAKGKLDSRVPQHSILLVSDNLVSPEEKRARAGRYQPKPKSSTMPTFTLTQGVAGAVDA